MKAEKSLRARALDLLSRGEYSRLQLAQKLAKYSEDEAEITALLDDLVERGWQSDERYAEVLIHSKSQRLGNRRLQQELQQKGVDAELFQDSLPSREAQLQTALEVLMKKFKVYQDDAACKTKYMRFLAYRGFDMGTIHDAIRQWRQQDDADAMF